ncbi:MAG: S8 family serine peptidase, partial [Cyclonatronaceae bacterium]
MKTRQNTTNIKLGICILISVLFLPAILVAQEHHYYSNQQKIYFEKAEHWVSVMLPEQQRSLLISRIEQDAQVHVRQSLDTERGIYWVETKQDGNVIDDLARLSLRTEGVQKFPVYYYVSTEQDTTWFATTDEFRVRFEEHTTEDEIRQLLEMYRAEVVRISEFGRFTLRVAEDAPYNTLETANRFYEHAKTVWSLPNFHMKIQTESIQDPLFDNQWHLRNTGQNGAISGIDINAEFAWDITTGSNDIIVAVIDNGVENHEDFDQGQLINGLTAGPTPGVGGPVNDEDAHGQAVAGIVAANHNTIGVRGVSSNVRIMPINIFAPNTNNEHRADAIDWAWQNGADILNNSWGCNLQECFDDDIAEAIERALTQGRNGRGAIVLKSAGNNGQFVTFPGTVSGVFVVGAVSSQNQKLWYTPDSELIDIIALSGDRFDSNNLDIVTMNREGQNGYQDGVGNQVVTQDSNYLISFDGTSAAVPQASGVAALMITVNPDLEARSVGVNPNPEIQNILRNTAVSYGSVDWTGHGRLNAYEAVKHALPNQLNSPFFAVWPS